MNKAYGLLTGLLFVAGSAHSGEAPAPAKIQAAEQAQAGERAAATPPARSGSRGADRLDLDATVVTGNRELPKVLYIVPWKKAELGDLPAQPFNTLLDEVLTPVDRDVFRREVLYFEASSKGGAPDDGRSPTPGTTP